MWSILERLFHSMQFLTVMWTAVIARFLLMTKELRQEVLHSSGGSTDANAVAEFRNDSAVTLSIMDIDYAHLMSNSDADEDIYVELSKAPVFQGRTNQSPFFTYPQILVGSGAPIGAAAGTAAINGGKSYDKGQLTLEPGESLFMNTARNAGDAELDATYVINYEF